MHHDFSKWNMWIKQKGQSGYIVLFEYVPDFPSFHVTQPPPCRGNPFKAFWLFLTPHYPPPSNFTNIDYPKYSHPKNV
jgi:hypothetical protein